MVVDERNKTLFVCVYQMPVMLIRIHGIIIMIYMIFWGTIYVIIKQKNWFWHICRVQKPWHTAKIWPRHRSWVTTFFAVGREWHTANPLPCARYIAHGKGRLCRSLVAVCALPCAAHGKGFAVGFWGFTVCQRAHGKGGVSRSALGWIPLKSLGI